MHRLCGEVLPRDPHIFGGDANTATALNRRRPIVAEAGRDHEPATSDAKIERLIQTRSTMLQQHVLAGDADVGRAVLDVRRHIGGAQHDKRYVRTIGRNDQFAGRRQVLVRHETGGRQQRQRLVEDAPLRERDGQGGHPAILPNHRIVYCRAVRMFGGAAAAAFVRKGLMSIPPRRVKRAYTVSCSHRQRESTSTKMRSTQCS